MLGELDFQLTGQLEVRAWGPLIQDHEGSEGIDGSMPEHRQYNGIANPCERPEVRLHIRWFDAVASSAFSEQFEQILKVKE